MIFSLDKLAERLVESFIFVNKVLNKRPICERSRNAFHQRQKIETSHSRSMFNLLAT